MAMLTAYRSFDMLAVRMTYDGLERFDSGEILARSEGTTRLWSGSFSYDPLGNVDGRLDRYVEFAGAGRLFEIREMATDAGVAMRAIIVDQTLPLLALVLDGHDRLTGSAFNDTLAGFGGNDLIRGGAGDDVLLGVDGHDQLHGGFGADQIVGGLGNDLIDGGAGRDLAVYLDSANGVNVSLQIKGFQFTGQGIDRLVSIEGLRGSQQTDRLTGNIFGNLLMGEGGNDTLVGVAGDDRLEGGTGADVLNGGKGFDLLLGGLDTARDVFLFTTIADSAVGARRDVISHFKNGEDRISLNPIDADDDLAGIQDLVFSGTQARAHSVWYSDFGRDVIVHVDVTGDLDADFQLRIEGVDRLSATDFTL